MHRPRRRRQRPLLIALYLNAAGLLAIAVALLTRQPVAMAQNQPAVAGGAGVFIAPAQFSDRNFGCYLMDVDQQTLCAYMFVPGEKQLRLMAARNFRYDRRLGAFNTDKPTPEEVRALIEKQDARAPAGAAQ
jgi:hypothetical protein